MHRLVAISLVVLLAVPFVGAAQAIPGRWEKVDALTRGSSITVTLTTGSRAQYAFVSSSPDLLVLANEDGKEIQFAKSDVRTIERVRGDRVRNGVLIGTGVGFGAGFLALAGFNAKQTASGPIWEGEAVAQYIAAGLVGAGIGALTGAAIDASRKEREIIYSRP
jgi:hypothetical protein